MENQSFSFRSALHGFNRADVINFLEKLSTSHECELRERDEELRVLREELREAQQALAGQSAEDTNQSLIHDAPDLPEEPAHDAVPDCSRELEAYRRAERHEREARARAEKLCAEATDAVNQASLQMEDHQSRMRSAADTLSADLAALHSAMTEILDEMNSSRDRLGRMKQEFSDTE